MEFPSLRFEHGETVAMLHDTARALPAAELIERLEAETIQAIRNLKGLLHEP
jgi:hypothetical protein